MNNHKVDGDDKSPPPVFEISHVDPLEVFNLYFAFLEKKVAFFETVFVDLNIMS